MRESVGVRQGNLGRLLRLVHLAGPHSRAALTEATGLNRSTVGDLIGELVEAGLVEETAPDPSRRVGRPSPVVSASGRIVAIAVHPEVDALTIAAVGLDGTIALRARHEIDHLLSPDETARLVAEQLGGWRDGELADHRLIGVGVAVPGLVRGSDGLVRNAPHLQWRDVALRDVLSAATGLPVVVGNDATLGAVAEHLYGAARGVDDVVYLNGGASGIGGGIVVGGTAVRGATGYAGEFGHNRPGIRSDSDRRSRSGVLESEVSRARLLAVAQLHNADEPTLAAALAASTSIDVHEEIARQRRILATALANVVNVLNPAVIVVGGFLATLVEGDVEGMLEMVCGEALTASADDLDLRVAVLAEDRLVIGAAEGVFEVLLRDPIAVSGPDAEARDAAERSSRAG